MKFYIFSLFKRLNLLFPLDILVLHECIVTLWPKVIISLRIFSAKMKEIFIELDHPGSLRGHDENSVKMFLHQLSWTDARDGPKTLAEEVRSTVRPTYNIHQHHVSKYIYSILAKKGKLPYFTQRTFRNRDKNAKKSPWLYVTCFRIANVMTYGQKLAFLQKFSA